MLEKGRGGMIVRYLTPDALFPIISAGFFICICKCIYIYAYVPADEMMGGSTLGVLI